MAKWGDMDFKEFEDFQKNLMAICEKKDKFCKNCSKALAGRLLHMVIKRTPVGAAPEQFENEKQKEYWEGYEGGTLRRGWTGGSEVKNAYFYANKLPVYKNEGSYTIVIENPVEYASYVEFGHRQTPGKFIPALGKRLTSNWTNGVFMLTLSEDDLKAIAPRVLEDKLNKFFSEIFV